MAVASRRTSRDALLALLAVTTGATDATAFERLGHVFASVITGNLVLLGVSAARGDGKLALFAGCALAGYSAGVVLAAPRGEASSQDGQWPTGTTLALGLDLVLLVIFGIGWLIAGAHPSELAQLLLLACAAAAMGVQSTAVRRIGQLSTTYLTSTLTGMLEALVVRDFGADQRRSLAILLAALAGAAAATLVVSNARACQPLVALIPLGIVIVASWRIRDR